MHPDILRAAIYGARAIAAKRHDGVLLHDPTGALVALVAVGADATSSVVLGIVPTDADDDPLAWPPESERPA